MKRYFLALASVFLLVSCVSEKDNKQVPSTDDTAGTVVAHEQGKIYVKFSDEMLSLIEDDLTDGNLVTRSAGLNQSLESLGITSMERVFTIGGEYEERQRRHGLHKWYTVTYSASHSLTKASDDLLHVKGVEEVAPVRRIAINDAVKFNDLNSDLWGLYNQNYAGIDINVRPVWDNYTVGDPSVVVAVVDSGVDINHVDLKDNCAGAYSYTNGPVQPGDHGTHVAGTIAAVSNNGKGVSGIAGGDHANGRPGVKIISCQIFADNRRVDNASANAIMDAADKGAVISQNSWGYVYDFNGDGTVDREEYNQAKGIDFVNGPDKAAIDYFIKNAGCDKNGNQRPDSPMKGGLVVFAAGNDNIDLGAPANYEKVIAVGAIRPDGLKADFSNYGSWVDIAAPGVSIKSTVPGGYDFMQGTSMACPHVSGVAALVLSYCGGPGFTADMLKEKLLKGANSKKTAPGDKIGPLVDALGAITYGDNVIPEPVTDLEGVGRGNNIDLSWTQTDDSNGIPVYGALAVYSTDRQKVADATAKSHEGCQATSFELGVAVGENISCTVRGLDFSKTYYCKVFNYTYAMNYSDASDVIEVTTTENSAPVVELDHDGDIVLKAHDLLYVDLTITEPDDHTYTVEYVSGSEADKLNKQGQTYSLVITGNAADAGTYEGEIKVTDEHGLATVLKVPYTIQPNAAPEKIKDIEDISLKSRSEEFRIDMSEYVSDADGEQLTYEYVIENPLVLFLNVRQDMIYGTPLQYGQTDVTVIAKDARGAKVELGFNVLVKDPSVELSVYPNPVKDYVNVSTGDEAMTSIAIYSSTGQKLYENTSTVSAREPARIDMRDFAPGVYAMTVKFSGKEFKETIVKI